MGEKVRPKFETQKVKRESFGKKSPTYWNNVYLNSE